MPDRMAHDQEKAVQRLVKKRPFLVVIGLILSFCIIFSSLYGTAYFVLSIIVFIIYLAVFSKAMAKEMNPDYDKIVSEYNQPSSVPDRLKKIANTLLLLISNLLVIYWAYKSNTPFVNLLVTYWIQTLMVFVFSILSIACLKRFAVSGYTYDKDKLYFGRKSFWEGIRNDDPSSKRKVAVDLSTIVIIFFSLYGVFIIAMFGISELDKIYLIQSSSIFFVSGLLYFFNSLSRRKKVEYIDLYFTSTLMRIVPIHLIFFVGALILRQNPELTSNMLLVMIVFVSLKLLVEIGMEINDEKIRNSAPSNRVNSRKS